MGVFGSDSTTKQYDNRKNKNTMTGAGANLDGSKQTNETIDLSEISLNAQGVGALATINLEASDQGAIEEAFKYAAENSRILDGQNERTIATVNTLASDQNKMVKDSIAAALRTAADSAKSGAQDISEKYATVFLLLGIAAAAAYIWGGKKR